MELADLVVINKADIDKDAATRAQAQITSALRLFGHQGNPRPCACRPRTPDSPAAEVRFWLPQVMQLSALLGTGVDAFWDAVAQFKATADGQRQARQAPREAGTGLDVGAHRRRPQARLPPPSRRCASCCPSARPQVAAGHAAGIDGGAPTARRRPRSRRRPWPSPFRTISFHDGTPCKKSSNNSKTPRPGAPRRWPEAHRRAACQGQADGARAHRAAARRQHLRRMGHVRRAPLERLRHGRQQDPGRRRGHRLRHDQRPPGVRLQPGLHRLRRRAQRSACREDLQGDGPGHEGRRAGHRPERFGRRPHPGRRGLARRLCRGVPAQRDGLGRGAADQHDHGPLRRRRRVFAGHDRLHLHGEGQQLHVRHRPRGGEDRDARGRHGRRTGRRHHPHHARAAWPTWRSRTTSRR